MKLNREIIYQKLKKMVNIYQNQYKNKIINKLINIKFIFQQKNYFMNLKMKMVILMYKNQKNKLIMLLISNIL